MQRTGVALRINSKGHVGERKKKEGIGIMEEVLAKVQTAFKSAFHVDPRTITLDTSPDDVPAWDSMGHVTLASDLERAFGLENVREICRVVQSKLGKVEGAHLQ
jgi:acyl carrier protein